MKERIKACWKKVTAKLPRLTRRGKLIRNLVCALLLAAVAWIYLGCPPLTAEQAFRRAERQNLIGPAEILAVGSLKKLPIQETEYEAATFEKEWKKVGFFAVGEQNGSVSCAWQLDGHLYFTEAKMTENVTFVPLWRVIAKGAVQGGLFLLKTELEGAAAVRVHLWEYNVRKAQEHDYRQYADSRIFCNMEGAGTVLDNGVFMIPMVASAMTLSTVEFTEVPPGLIQITIYDEYGDIIYNKMWVEEEGGTYYESRQEPIIR